MERFSIIVKNELYNEQTMERNSIDKKSTSKRKLAGAAIKKESVTKAIEKALFEEWVERGYSSISLESVAKRAKVGKAAIYRRWPSKPTMVIDLVNKVGNNLIRVADTGNLHDDIYQLLLQIRKILRHRTISRILPDLHAEMARNTILAAGIRTTVQIQRRQSAEAILRKAIERKEVACDINIEMILDLLGSMIYWRMIITKNRADKKYLNALANLIVGVMQNHENRCH